MIRCLPTPRLMAPARAALAALLLLAASLAAGCAQTPLTGRSQLLLFPEGEMLTLSIDAYSQMMSQETLVTHTPEGQMVVRVGERIAAATEEYMISHGLGHRLDRFAWEFNLVQNDAVNAFCMPGGKVAFFTGILPICQDENGVAVVMGHEIAHALAQHGNERMSQAVLLGAGTAAAAAIGARDSPQRAAVFAGLFGVGGTLAVGLPHSRRQEYEADEIGLVLMSLAGYDPREAPRFWERMAAASGNGGGPEFLSTHPVSTNRVARLESMLPDAITVYETGVLPYRWSPHRLGLGGGTSYGPAWLDPIEVAFLRSQSDLIGCCAWKETGAHTH